MYPYLCFMESKNVDTHVSLTSKSSPSLSLLLLRRRSEYRSYESESHTHTHTHTRTLTQFHVGTQSQVNTHDAKSYMWVNTITHKQTHTQDSDEQPHDILAHTFTQPNTCALSCTHTLTHTHLHGQEHVLALSLSHTHTHT